MLAQRAWSYRSPAGRGIVLTSYVAALILTIADSNAFASARRRLAFAHQAPGTRNQLFDPQVNLRSTLEVTDMGAISVLIGVLIMLSSGQSAFGQSTGSRPMPG
jgi:hypothetical protein